MYFWIKFATGRRNLEYFTTATSIQLNLIIHNNWKWGMSMLMVDFMQVRTGEMRLLVLLIGVNALGAVENGTVEIPTYAL